MIRIDENLTVFTPPAIQPSWERCPRCTARLIYVQRFFQPLLVLRKRRLPQSREFGGFTEAAVRYDRKKGGDKFQRLSRLGFVKK